MPKPTLCVYYECTRTMDIEHCLTVRLDNWICEIQCTADKTLSQRLLYMSVARLPPLRTSTNNGTKIQINWKWQVKICKILDFKNTRCAVNLPRNTNTTHRGMENIANNKIPTRNQKMTTRLKEIILKISCDFTLKGYDEVRRYLYLCALKQKYERNCNHNIGAYGNR